MLRPRVGLCLPVSIEGVASAAEIHVRLCGQGRHVVLHTPQVQELGGLDDRAEALRVTQQLLDASADPHVFIDSANELMLLLSRSGKIHLGGNIFLARDKTLRDELIRAELLVDTK